MDRMKNFMQGRFRKAFSRRASSADELSEGQEEKPLSAQPGMPPDAGLPQVSPYRRKSSLGGGLAEPAHTRPEALDDRQELYRELVAAARFALSGTIDKERIEALIGRVSALFEKDSYDSLLLVAFSFSRNDYLPAHIASGVILTTAFARSLGYGHQDILELGICAFSHDLGMANFPGASKSDQQLTPEEIEEIKQHPFRSAEIVRPFFTEKIAAVLVDVHERENGQGYPRGIPGSQIHLWAKIIAVCDTFVALTHPRAFRAAYTPYEALKMIIKKKDILFDHEIVKRFIDFQSIYPVGSLVNLNSGETAMVVAAVKGAPTRPVIQVLVNVHREIEDGDIRIDLSKKDFVYISAVIEREKEKEILYFIKPRRQVVLDEL